LSSETDRPRGWYRYGASTTIGPTCNPDYCPEGCPGHSPLTAAEYGATRGIEGSEVLASLIEDVSGLSPLQTAASIVGFNSKIAMRRGSRVDTAN
jgi:hypothetical protein